MNEQVLADDITSFGLKKLDGDRNVENYDFKAVQEMRAKERAEQAELEEGEMRDDELEEGEMRNDELEEGEMRDDDWNHVNKDLKRR